MGYQKGTKFVAVADHQGNTNDKRELSLRKGDIVVLEHPANENETMWYGMRSADGKIGYFPRDIVQIIELTGMTTAQIARRNSTHELTSESHSHGRDDQGLSRVPSSPIEARRRAATFVRRPSLVRDDALEGVGGHSRVASSTASRAPKPAPQSNSPNPPLRRPSLSRRTSADDFQSHKPSFVKMGSLVSQVGNWIELIQDETTQDLGPKDKQRMNAIWELYSTERDYVRDLNIVNMVALSKFHFDPPNTQLACSNSVA